MIGISIQRKLRLAGLALAFFSALLLSLGGSSPASARHWKPDVRTQAQDYVQIFYDKSKGDVSMVWWLTPQMMPNSPEAEQVLDKYVIIAVLHATWSADGVANFDAIDSLQAKDVDGNPMKLLGGNSMPADVAKLLVGLGNLARQSTGGLAQGVHLFVFEAGAVHACAKGGISVPFGGENYTYETPIPGCL